MLFFDSMTESMWQTFIAKKKFRFYIILIFMDKTL